MTIAKRLDTLELEDSHSGEMIRLGTLWQDRSTVLIFLRHFG